jgi:hypothetical protein
MLSGLNKVPANAAPNNRSDWRRGSDSPASDLENSSK